MDPKNRSYLARTLGILLGLFILLLVYRMVRSELNLRSDQKAFALLQHPQNTERLDSFDLEADYYPATSADNSVRFESASLIGELRSYSGDWQNIQAFYQDQVLGDGVTKIANVVVFPVEIRSEGQKTLLKFSDDFSYSPFEYDLLDDLKRYYLSRELPQIDTGRKFYLIYVTSDI